MTRDEAEALILSFPKVEEGASYGRPAYKAFGKFFTRFRREDGTIVLGSVPHDERDMLIEIDPDTFFSPTTSGTIPTSSPIFPGWRPSSCADSSPAPGAGTRPKPG